MMKPDPSQTTDSRNIRPVILNCLLERQRQRQGMSSNPDQNVDTTLESFLETAIEISSTTLAGKMSASKGMKADETVSTTDFARQDS
jgi:hypothetical protein